MPRIIRNVPHGLGISACGKAPCRNCTSIVAQLLLNIIVANDVPPRLREPTSYKLSNESLSPSYAASCRYREDQKGSPGLVVA